MRLHLIDGPEWDAALDWHIDDHPRGGTMSLQQGEGNVLQTRAVLRWPGAHLPRQATDLLKGNGLLVPE